MEIFDRLYWINGRSVNAFLVADEDGFGLVDAGMPGRMDVLGYLRDLGQPADALKWIAVTHADIDHIGNVALLQRASGATLYAGRETADLLVRGGMPSHGSRILDWLFPRLMSYEPVERSVITVVEDGDELPVLGGLTVIATPGHTPDHHAFHSAQRGVCFAGDALHTRRGKLAVSPRSIAADFRTARRSAIKLAELSPAIFACGHGDPYLHTYDDLMDLLNAARTA